MNFIVVTFIKHISLYCISCLYCLFVPHSWLLSLNARIALTVIFIERSHVLQASCKQITEPWVFTTHPCRQPAVNYVLIWWHSECICILMYTTHYLILQYSNKDHHIYKLEQKVKLLERQLSVAEERCRENAGLLSKNSMDTSKLETALTQQTKVRHFYKCIIIMVCDIISCKL